MFGSTKKIWESNLSTHTRVGQRSNVVMANNSYVYGGAQIPNTRNLSWRIIANKTCHMKTSNRKRAPLQPNQYGTFYSIFPWVTMGLFYSNSESNFFCIEENSEHGEFWKIQENSEHGEFWKNSEKFWTWRILKKFRKILKMENSEKFRKILGIYSADIFMIFLSFFASMVVILFSAEIGQPW